MKRQIPAALVVAPILVIVAAVAFFFLVKPKMDAASNLDDRIAEFQQQVDVALVAQRQAAGGDEDAIRVADLFRLTKAMPDTTDMAGVILELKAVADASGVEFNSIAPQAGAPRADGLVAVPISLSFSGNYYDLTDFLFRLRNLVYVRDGTLEATGRLFVLDNLALAEGAEGFPSVDAALSLSAFVYAPLPAPAAEAPAEPPADPAADPALGGAG